jgi:hypothetical protein
MGSRSVIEAAMNVVRRAEEALQQTLQREFPIGSNIQWVIGGFVYKGIVVSFGWLARVYVLNEKTNTHRWIQAAHIYPGFPTGGRAERD